MNKDLTNLKTSIIELDLQEASLVADDENKNNVSGCHPTCVILTAICGCGAKGAI
ncbi:hypothetical protein [Treponema pedis]|uniref:hypothetical protein n=1 Tax=Treponema pedis TaxID=409322 RepID=UPI00042A3ED9|nr:hypothetical protein [Treponema pedis]